MSNEIQFFSNRGSEERYYGIPANELTSIIANAGFDLEIVAYEDNSAFAFSKDGKELFEVTEFWLIEVPGDEVGCRLSLIDSNPRPLEEALRNALKNPCIAMKHQKDRLTFADADDITKEVVKILSKYEVKVSPPCSSSSTPLR